MALGFSDYRNRDLGLSEMNTQLRIDIPITVYYIEKNEHTFCIELLSLGFDGWICSLFSFYKSDFMNEPGDYDYEFDIFYLSALYRWIKGGLR